MNVDFSAVLIQWPMLLNGIAITLIMTLIATLFGIVLGIACGWYRANGPRTLRWLIAGYVELVRNTPYIIQLFFIFFWPAGDWRADVGAHCQRTVAGPQPWCLRQ